MKAWQKTIITVGLMVMVASCRNDPAPQRPKIEKIAFEEKVRNIFVGDTVKVNIAAFPIEAKIYDKIEYRASESGIIEIKADSGNDGVVFEGIKRGSTVITALVNGVIDYCSVNVLGGNESVIPHIIVPNYVMECRENERRSIVASLAGGTPLDDSGFIWSYTGQKTISLESTGNIGVFDTLNIGESVVTISHPKAQFSVDVLVYVIGNDEIPIYITTDNNVVNLKTTDTNYQYAVELRGGNSGDYYNFRHELLDGGEVIELLANNNIGTINPKAKGIARIGVSHLKAAYRMEIVVIVNEEIEYRYINVDKTLIIMEEGYSEILKAELIGDAPLDKVDKYTFENENNDVIGVQQSHDHFSITALQRGMSVIKIKNEYADFNREVLVIVNGIGGIQDNETYITTNQNVITTEVGGNDVLLTMTLVGGNEADRNNFVWTVDDGSIISVESAHGTVQYKNRAAVNNTGEKFEGQALIKAKKVGTAKITLENPKAKNTFSVIVKVYKKGVFDVVPVVIDGPSIYKVAIGEKISAYLKVVTGNERNLANVTWSSENNSIVSVSGAGLTGMLEGEGVGITTITISGDNLKHDYTATVIVGGDEYLKAMPFIYAVNPFVSIVKGGSISFRIMCENMSSEEIAGINVVNNSGDIMEVFAYRNNITITGIALGEGEIIVSGEGLNTIRVVVMVEDHDLNPDVPYYLRTDTFIHGLARGHNLEIGVDLVGGSEVNERNIVWKIEDSNVAAINGNGKRCVITGRNVGQTIITVSHPKSHNELEIVVYAVEHETELNSKVVMYVKEKNMLLNTGETRYISIITNANDAQKNSFQWDVSNANVVDVNVSGDRIKAYVVAKSVGNSIITVRSGNTMVPVAIYITVLNKIYNGTYINVPSIVEMVAGDTLSINAVTNNIHDKMNITWSVKNDDIAVVYGNGDTCLLNALNCGNTVIKVEYKPDGFVKDIMLYVYNGADEMASKHIIAGEQSRYVINKGDIINVHLVFGMKGYPDYELHNIWWRTGDSTVIGVTGNGKTANVQGLNAGRGTITVSGIDNTVEIEVEVQENRKAGQYWFSINEQDRIKGILTGSYADIDVRVFNGSNEVFNVSGIEYIVEHDDIISVTANGSSIRVTATAGKEGQSYITVRHDLVEDARILIYTALSEYSLENAYPVLVDKTNYLIKKGDNLAITIQTKDNDNAKLRNISYGLERNNGVISVSERNKREIAVNANNVGSDVILVRYNAAVVQRIYVSVTEGNYGSNVSYMITENIIGLLWDAEYETRVDTNVEYGITWKKQDDYVIDIVSSSGKSAVIKGTLLGKTILTVSGGGIERNIVVFVCKTEDELRQYQAINLEQRQYRIRKNDNITINIHSYQGKVEGETRYGDYYNYDNPYGNVIAVNAVENNKFSVKGINEGVAAIRITNEYYQTEMVVYIEVAPAGEGGAVLFENRHYMTAPKTLYVIDKDERNVFILVDVIGDNFYGDAYWVWSDYDESIINVSPMGREAAVNPRKEGQTKIKITNKDCANSLEITVIVGERFVVDDGLLPYIYVEKNVYEITKDSGTISIPYNVINVDNINVHNIGYKMYGSTISVSHDVNNGVFNVTALETGVSRFDIVYGNLRRDVYVMVKENMNFGNIYLTTGDNYVIASIGELKTINIQLAGYSEINNNNFTWSVDKTGVVQLVGNGATGQIYGVGAGDAVIMVRHPKAEPYPLKINVKIAKDKVKEKIVYLTTQRNVIETVEGAAGEQIYVQKIGGDIAKDKTTWTVSDSSIVDITYRGYAAQYTAKKEGVARIQVENIESDYKLEIVIIVKAALKNNIYIDSVSNLLLLDPREAQRRISVVLVNGDAKDNNKFKWLIDHQQPSDVNVAAVANSKVISIIGSNDECFINAVNEGVARIRVHNDKAERDLFITVYVTHYKDIGFSVNKKEIVVGENEFVGINLPTYEYLGDKVKIWVEQIDGSSGSGICEVFYTNELALLSGKKTGVVIVKAAIEGKDGEAQLYVNVVENANPNVNRIITGKTLYVLNPKSNPLILNAIISGPNVFDVDNDNIQWQIPPHQTGIIDIAPKNEPISNAKGRQVQITPKGLGTATVLIKHGYVDEEYWKEITFIVANANNYFSVSRTDITVNTLRPETVAAEIVGGTTRDYAEIKWTAKMQQKWDGTMLEVVRIMGSGREVTLYPMNDGETEVLAIYGKEVLVIKVKVVSDYYFSFRNGNEYMWPGERRDLPFDVKPASSNINWINVNSGGDEPVVTYGEVLGSSPAGSGNVERYLQVEARREGTAVITGMANGKIASVNIIVQYDYSFVLDRIVEGEPQYTNVDSSSTGIMEASYTVHPANTYIKPLNNNIPGLTIEVMTPVERKDNKGRTVGVGKIKFTGVCELREMVEFQQYKARMPGNDSDAAVENTERQPSKRTIDVRFYFKNVVKPIPYFIRGDGKYSNISNPNTTSSIPTANGPFRLKKDDSVQGELITGNGSNYSLSLGDGEAHYILFDKQYDTAKLNITGISVVGGNSANGTGMPVALASFDNSNFTASIVDMQIDGIMRKAIRLSGGSDYIKYSRVQFDKELFVEVTSPYYNGSQTNIINEEMDIYEREILLEFYSNIAKWTGPWHNVDNPSIIEISQGERIPAEMKRFYCLKRNDIDRLSTLQKNTFMKEPYLKHKFSDDWLINYYDNNAFDYYFYGDEFNMEDRSTNQVSAAFHDLIYNKCQYYEIYKPRFYYTGSIYNGNKALFDADQYLRKYIFDNPNTVNYITSYINIGNLSQVMDDSAYDYVAIYEYDPDELEMLKENHSVNYDLNNWDKGSFNESTMISKIQDYDSNMLYSSHKYTININNININGNNEFTTVYNVFRNYYVNNVVDSIEVPPVGVKLQYYTPVTSNLENNYGDGSLILYHEYGAALACYDNVIRGLPVYIKGKPYYSPHDDITVPFIGFMTANSYKVVKYPASEHTYYYVNYNFPSVFLDVRYYFGGLWTTSGKTPETWVYCGDPYVKNKLIWQDRNTVITVPYYIFNRFPFKFDFYNSASINDPAGGGRPMPSIARTQVYSVDKQLEINYEGFITGNANRQNEETGKITLNINIRVRPCHSQYVGTRYNDSYINYDEFKELEGAITDFSNINQNYNNDKIRNYFN